MDLSESFNKEVSADVILHLRTSLVVTAVSKGGQPSSSPARSFFLHRIVLDTTQYFSCDGTAKGRRRDISHHQPRDGTFSAQRSMSMSRRASWRLWRWC
jgi:hypothetical protein